MANAPKLLVDEEDSVDDTTLLDMDACFTAFDRDGYVYCVLKFNEISKNKLHYTLCM